MVVPGVVKISGNAARANGSAMMLDRLSRHAPTFAHRDARISAVQTIASAT
jgi:hypothetical protein